MSNEQEYSTEIVAAMPALEQISRAECDVQISTAKKYPMHSDQKGLERFKTDAISMATLDDDTAKSCLYTLTREGKNGTVLIEGKSVRLAEIVVAAYGNIRAGARIVEVGEKEVVAQGACHDLERNVYQSAEVRRRIVNKWGKRYSDDMITMTCNAASSIAFRNAVFKVIPSALCEPAYQAARTKATGGKAALEVRRAKAIKAFELYGVNQERVLHRLGKIALANVDETDLALLIGLYNSIKGGETEIDETFPVQMVSNATAAILDHKELLRKLKDIGVSPAEALTTAKILFGAPKVSHLETLTKAQAEELVEHFKKVENDGYEIQSDSTPELRATFTGAGYATDDTGEPKQQPAAEGFFKTHD